MLGFTKQKQEESTSKEAKTNKKSQSVVKQEDIAQVDEMLGDISYGPSFLLSTDSLSGYGLDLIFDVAAKAGFDGLDLAIWKSFDSRHSDYVRKLSEKHDMPVKVIQTSNKVNLKEMSQALDLCEATGADTIAFNSPTIFNLKTFNFLVDNLPTYRKDNPDIKFTIINPQDSSLFGLPIPKYRFSNIVEIIKKYECYLGLDIANMDDNAFEMDFLRKVSQYVPYLSVLYFSDKTKLGQGHVLPGEGVLKLSTLLTKLKQNKFSRYFSVKVDIEQQDLADSDKVILILQKAREYLKDHFEDIEVNE